MNYTAAEAAIRTYLDKCDEEGFKFGAPRMAADLVTILRELEDDRTARGFVCDTALGWDLCPENGRAVEIYGSEEVLRVHRTCAKPAPGCCGIVEVEVRTVRTVQANRLRELTGVQKHEGTPPE